ncbi:MAG TPA: asparaginase [Thermoanaerobaculia bacterium]|nr:asparaginase [Thermoanaerobaculia bacterium]HUM30946.1 asparaginase [Thermoanaerobaculia bacterium]HXK69394.1 asparaginase [Thermoanaerobaculia bacterium]
MRKKILVLFCGGTIVMKEDEQGVLQAPEDREAVEILQSIEPRLTQLAEYDLHHVANVDSTNINPETWNRLLFVLKAQYERYDGFVITHGTDTMAYTSTALAIATRGLAKPVVLTGSQIPGRKVESDARRNLVNAFRMAVSGIPGVFIVFDTRVLSGVRATKASESKMDAFVSVNTKDAGEIRLDLRMDPSFRTKQSRGAFQILPGFDPNILVHLLTPGCHPETLQISLREGGVHGILLLGYGSGNVPSDLEPFFQEAYQRKVPVVVTSQCLEGRTLMNHYGVGRRALDRGVIEGFDQSVEALAVKLMWALNHYPFHKIKGIIHKNICGEIDTGYVGKTIQR